MPKVVSYFKATKKGKTSEWMIAKTLRACSAHKFKPIALNHRWKAVRTAPKPPCTIVIIVPNYHMRITDVHQRA